MLLLFCDNLDSPDLPPAAGAFLKQKAPKNLIRERDQAEKEVDRIVGDLSTLLFVLSIIAGFIFMIGWSCLGAFIQSDVTLREGYHNAPFIFWLTGICLTVGGIPLLFARILSRRIYSFEKVRSAQENADVLEDSIQEYLSVPEQIVKADILSFSYREDSGHLSVSGAASNLEVFLYKWDQDLCIYDGKNTFLLLHDEISSIRVIDQAIPVANWNKFIPSSKKQFRSSGVLPYQGSIKGLRFCCALDIFHAGELYSLLFPAYELSVIQELTGLPSPDLPEITLTGEIRHKKQESQWMQADEKIRPQFYWMPPKGKVGYWFTPQSDAEFQTKHPVLYKVLIIGGIIVIFLPAIWFCSIDYRRSGLRLSEWMDTDLNGWMLPGFLGGMSVGLGFFNIVAAWMHQYLGHFMTILFFLIGLIMMGGSLAMMQM